MRPPSDAPMQNRNISFPRAREFRLLICKIFPPRLRLLQFVSSTAKKQAFSEPPPFTGNLNISIGTRTLRGSMKCGSNWRVPLREMGTVLLFRYQIEHDKILCICKTGSLARSPVRPPARPQRASLLNIYFATVRGNRFIRSSIRAPDVCMYSMCSIFNLGKALSKYSLVMHKRCIIFVIFQFAVLTALKFAILSQCIVIILRGIFVDRRERAGFCNKSLFVAFFPGRLLYFVSHVQILDKISLFRRLVLRKVEIMSRGEREFESKLILYHFYIIALLI